MELTDVLIGEKWFDRLSDNLDNYKYNMLLSDLSGIRNYVNTVTHTREKRLKDRFAFIDIRNDLIEFTQYLDELMENVEALYQEALDIYKQYGRNSREYVKAARSYGLTLHCIGDSALQEFNKILGMSREYVEKKPESAITLRTLEYCSSV